MGKPRSDESRYRRCSAELERRGQQHLLRWWDDLEQQRRRHLLSDIEGVLWDEFDSLIDTHVRSKPASRPLGQVEPAASYSQDPGELQAKYDEAITLGDELIRAGKLAAFTVAGGQGSRLGFDGPKGAVTVSPIREKSLFELFAQTILAIRKRYRVQIPWLIMTSPSNHKQTIGFLEDHDYCGMPREDVILFPQLSLPSFDFDGHILMADKHRIALAPDGHGGSLGALVSSGAIDAIKSRGIEMISYFQVDNPLVKVMDPLFIGLHKLDQSEMSTKVARKVSDTEKVGNLCIQNGCLRVVEYSDFPAELAARKNPDGSRTFDLGNLGIHLLNVDFVESLDSANKRLRYHRAEKKVTWVDENGFMRSPKDPNGVKLERFVFDALPLAKNPMLLEVDRAEEFSPIKNPHGVDSVESAKADQVRRAANWLEAAGVEIPRDADGTPLVQVEIAPSWAIDAEDVRRRLIARTTFEEGETIYIS